MNKWHPVISVALSLLLTIGIVVVLNDWKHILMYVGLSTTWFYSGRIITNYTIYQLLVKKDIIK